MRKCNNAPRFAGTPILSKAVRVLWLHAGLGRGGQMNDDLTGRRVASAGGNRSDAAAAHMQVARLAPARWHCHQNKLPQSLVIFVTGPNGEQHVVTHERWVPDRGAVLSLAA
jgi:hypothetical protein